ncbi:unnamed protein product [Lactuca saligna]|uniref:Uncharacterized protein n=1 Tax=Lactuca saligna TaxID=75948 RepID=A0AA35ZND6_LACSI|nr:unnamed protein product [Lactuca saligna]
MKLGALQLLGVPLHHNLRMMLPLRGLPGGANPSISDLRAEISILNQKIIKKEINVGALSVGYFDLKNNLIAEFGDKFKTTVEDPKEVETSPSAPTNTSQQDPFVNPPLVRTTIVIGHFEIKPAQAHPRSTLKYSRRQVST